MSEVKVFTANPLLLFTSVYKIPFLAILVPLVLLAPTAAHTIPISYQFHGEITEVIDISPNTCKTPPCIPAVTLGEKYTGFLLYDFDTINPLNIGNQSLGLGGVPFYSLVFDNFVMLGDNTMFGFIGSFDGGTDENDKFSITDEIPQGIGIATGADNVDINLLSDTPNAITDINPFPSDLDEFNSGSVGSFINDWFGPYSNDVWEATIEDFRRVGSEPVPEPAAIWLFGIGLIGLVGFSKRRKAN